MKSYVGKPDAILLLIEEKYKKVSLQKYLYLKCRLLSLPYITIWRAINGHTMSLATVKKISKILELSPNELFEEVDDKNL